MDMNKLLNQLSKEELEMFNYIENLESLSRSTVDYLFSNRG